MVGAESRQFAVLESGRWGIHVHLDTLSVTVQVPAHRGQLVDYASKVARVAVGGAFCFYASPSAYKCGFILGVGRSFLDYVNFSDFPTRGVALGSKVVQFAQRVSFPANVATIACGALVVGVIRLVIPQFVFEAGVGLVGMDQGFTDGFDCTEVAKEKFGAFALAIWDAQVRALVVPPPDNDAAF